MLPLFKISLNFSVNEILISEEILILEIPISTAFAISSSGLLEPPCKPAAHQLVL